MTKDATERKGWNHKPTHPAPQALKSLFDCRV